MTVLCLWVTKSNENMCRKMALKATRKFNEAKHVPSMWHYFHIPSLFVQASVDLVILYSSGFTPEVRWWWQSWWSQCCQWRLRSSWLYLCMCGPSPPGPWVYIHWWGKGKHALNKQNINTENTFTWELSNLQWTSAQKATSRVATASRKLRVSPTCSRRGVHWRGRTISSGSPWCSWSTSAANLESALDTPCNLVSIRSKSEWAWL